MSDIVISDRLKNHYDDYYEEGYSEWCYLGAIGKADSIISLCRSYPHDSILEIGAGEGSVLKRLSEFDFGKELYAIEVSSTGIERIKKKDIHSLVECKLFDGYNIPYDNGKFDLAVLSHVLEHVEYPRKLLYEASRVAEYVFIEVPLEDTIRLSPDFRLDKLGHINFYSPKTIRILIQTCDLRILGQKLTHPFHKTYTYRLGKKGPINFLIKECLLRITPRIATGIFTYYLALICRKNNAHE